MKTKYWFPFFLLVVIFFTYSRAFHAHLMLDDYLLLTGPKNIATHAWGDLWIQPTEGFYRPVAATLLKCRHLFFGNHFTLYAVFNASLVWLVGILLFILLKRWDYDEKIAAVAVTLWIVHPFNSFLVFYKTAGDISFALVFMCLSLFFVDEKQKSQRIFLYIFYVVALLTHEISLVIPLVWFGVARFLQKLSWREIAKEILIFAILTTTFLLLRHTMISSSRVPSVEYLTFSFGEYIDAFVRLMRWYFQHLVWPTDVIFLWDEKVGGIYSFISWIFVGLIFGSAILFLIKTQNALQKFLAWMWLVGFLIIPFAMLTYTQRTKSVFIEPHWLAFSSLGLFSLLVWSMLKVNRWGKFLLLGIFVFWFLQTRILGAWWQNEALFCQRWYQLSPTNGTAVNGIANAFVRQIPVLKVRFDNGECVEIPDSLLNSNSNHPSTQKHYYCKHK